MIGDYAGGDGIDQPRLDGLSYSAIISGALTITLDGRSMFVASTTSPSSGAGWDDDGGLRHVAVQAVPTAPGVEPSDSKASPGTSEAHRGIAVLPAPHPIDPVDPLGLGETGLLGLR